jgi:hypothetical protein
MSCLIGVISLVCREGNQQLVYLFGTLFLALLFSGILSGALYFGFSPKAEAGGMLCRPWVPRFVRVRVRWENRGDDALMELPVDLSVSRGMEGVIFRSRMKIGGVRRVIRWRDATGLFVWQRCGTIPGTIRHDPERRRGVLPKFFYDASEGESESPSGKASGDLTDSRNYQTGDSIRRILWSAVAKQGGLARAGNRLMVRSEDRVTSRRVAVFFLPGGEDDAAAGFVRSCIENNLFGDDLVFSTTGCPEPLSRSKGDMGRFLEVLDATAVPSPSWDLSLAEFRVFARRVRSSGIQTLFVMGAASFLGGDHGREAAILALDRGTRILAVASKGEAVHPFSSNQTKVVETELAS